LSSSRDVLIEETRFLGGFGEVPCSVMPLIAPLLIAFHFQEKVLDEPKIFLPVTTKIW